MRSLQPMTKGLLKFLCVNYQCLRTQTWSHVSSLCPFNYKLRWLGYTDGIALQAANYCILEEVKGLENSHASKNPFCFTCCTQTQKGQRLIQLTLLLLKYTLRENPSFFYFLVFTNEILLNLKLTEATIFYICVDQHVYLHSVCWLEPPLMAFEDVNQ